jgi:hypothetical protein
LLLLVLLPLLLATLQSGLVKQTNTVLLRPPQATLATT